jgi:hypothetical protein
LSEEAGRFDDIVGLMGGHASVRYLSNDSISLNKCVLGEVLGLVKEKSEVLLKRVIEFNETLNDKAVFPSCVAP